MRASWRGDRDIVLLLLHSGADVNRMNYNGATAMFYAAAGGNPEVMKALVKSGANLNVKDKLGQSSLHWAVAANQVGMVGVDGWVVGSLVCWCVCWLVVLSIPLRKK